MEETRSIWKNEDIQAQLTNLNWSSNGWINGAVKLTGDAKAYIHDIRTTGKTIEMEFEKHNVSDLDSKLITCWEGKKGIRITSG